MITERKAEEFEDDRKKWKIYFDINSDHLKSEMSVVVKFTINRDKYPDLTEKDIENLKQDLRDLGKFRIIKQGKEFLEKWRWLKKWRECCISNDYKIKNKI